MKYLDFTFPRASENLACDEALLELSEQGGGAEILRVWEPRDYFVVEGARSWTVSDQLMKRELILQGMGWGHMPKFLIDQDLRENRLLDITGKYLRGGAADIVAAESRQILQ